MEFITWEMLMNTATLAAIVGLITQATKGIKFIEKMPTQVWSWILAAIILELATFFTGGMTLESGSLALINSLIASLAANGGFSFLDSVKNVGGVKNGN